MRWVRAAVLWLAVVMFHGWRALRLVGACMSNGCGVENGGRLCGCSVTVSAAEEGQNF